MRALFNKSMISIIVLTCTIVSVSFAQQTWRKIQYPYFTIISQANDKDTRRLANEFICFVNTLKKIVPSDYKNLPPLTIVIFNGESNLEPYKPERPDGKQARYVSGFFAQTETWSIIGISKGFSNAEARRLIYHEGVHWYLSAARRQFSTWFQEGMAEVFSTYELKNKTISWGNTIDEHIEWLIEEQLMPLDEFLKVDQRNALFNNALKTSMFYSQSWAFVHYLLYNKDDSLSTICKQFRDALSSMEADRVINNLSIDKQLQMSEQLRSYVMKGSLEYSELPAENVIDTSCAIVDASHIETSFALAHLLIGTKKTERARAIGEQIISQAPKDPSGYEILAQVSLIESKQDQVLDNAQNATIYGSKDPQMYLLAANQKWDMGAKSGKLSQIDARSIADLYKSALLIQPNFLLCYKNFSGIVANIEQCTDDDFRLLESGSALFPNEGDLLFGMAVVKRSLGDYSSALTFLEKAQTMSATLSQDRIPILNKLKLQITDHQKNQSSLPNRKK